MFLRAEQRVFWLAVSDGVSSARAAWIVGAGEVTARYWMRQRGGVIPQHLLRELSPRFLSPIERAAIMTGRAQGLSIRRIAAVLGRSPSTVSREMSRNRRGAHRYDARTAQVRAERRRCRPRPSKLALDEKLRRVVQDGLDLKWSPMQISRRLVEQFPGDERMRVSHETIYQAIYVQARGSLKREVEARVRTGRTLRKPRRQHSADRSETRIRDMIMISERPAEIEDRAIPGHWEGDLIIGKDNGSQIGTLVERATRYCLLLHLPKDRRPETVAEAMVEKIRSLPTHLIRSITWDQGIEMAHHKTITFATDVDIYFCDPHSPWQRGSNENTNGLLRQYFPKGTDLGTHSAEHLDAVAIELNGRPRQTLNWKTPAEALNALLSTQQQPGVATTT
jgi:IS30 family transposase